MRLLFLHFTPLLRGAISRTLGSILNLNIFLGASEDVPHLGDLVFHQMLIKEVGDLQPTDEHGNSHTVITVIYQSYLALKITDILLEALPRLHLDCER